MGKFLLFPVGPGSPHYYGLWYGPFNGYTGYEPDATFVKDTGSTNGGIYLTKHSTVDGNAEWIAGIYANSTVGTVNSGTFESSVNMADDGGVFVCMSITSSVFVGHFTVFRSADGTTHSVARSQLNNGYISRWTADGQLMWVHGFGTANNVSARFQGMQVTQLSDSLISLHVGMFRELSSWTYTFTDGSATLSYSGGVWQGARNTFQIRLNALTGGPSGLPDGRGLFRSTRLEASIALDGHVAYFNNTALGSNYYVSSWANNRDQYVKLINEDTPDSLVVTNPFADIQHGSMNHVARYNTSDTVFQGLSRFGLGRTASLTSDKRTYQSIHPSRVGGYYSIAWNNFISAPTPIDYDLGYRVYNEDNVATIYTLPESVYGRSAFIVRCQENGTPIWAKYFGGNVTNITFGSLREERDVFEDDDGFAVYWLRYSNFSASAIPGSTLNVHDNFDGIVSRTYPSTATQDDENCLIEKVNQNTGALEWGVSINIENNTAGPFCHMVRSRRNIVEVYIRSRRTSSPSGISTVFNTPSGSSTVVLPQAPLHPSHIEDIGFFRVILDYQTGNIISGLEAEYLGQWIRATGTTTGVQVRLSNTFI